MEVEVETDVGTLLVMVVEVVEFKPKGSFATSASVGSSFNSGPINLPQLAHLRSLYPAQVGFDPRPQGRLPMYVKSSSMKHPCQPIDVLHLHPGSASRGPSHPTTSSATCVFVDKWQLFAVV